ncbi:hypothetical protein [Microcoleus sp. S13_B4]|uniref:hypothetical protein n=1 Tax=Microcoleus sp. S13_B4 TaxID=3055408 RepID=UPI002FD3EB64
MTPRINSGASFIGYTFFISGRMNPGAYILDAFGQEIQQQRASEITLFFVNLRST